MTKAEVWADGNRGAAAGRSAVIRRGGWALGLGLALALAACGEREEILTGPREELDAVLSGADAAAEAVPENRALPVNLPGAVANQSWTQAHGTPSTRTDQPAYSGALQPIWNAKIGAGQGRRHRITADPVVAGGRVFTLDAEAKVAATGTNGAPAWSVDLVPPRDRARDATGGGLAYADGTLFVTSGFGTLTALDAATGGQKWQQKLSANATGAPTVRNGVVYLTAGDETAWAVNAETGRIEWQLDATPSKNNILGQPAPAVNDQVAVFAFGSDEVQAAFRGGGLRVWEDVISGQRFALARTRVTDVTGDPVIVGPVVYVGTQAGRLAAIRVATGERIWTANEGAMNAVWVAGGSIFMVSDRNELLRLSAEDGSRIWGVKLPFFVKDRPRRQKEIFAHYGPVLAGGRLIVASNDGLIRMFDPASGALIGTGEIPGGAASDPVFAGGVMYVVSGRGELYAFR